MFDFQTKLQGWEVCAGHSLIAVYGGTFIVLSFTDASSDLIDKIVPISIGTPRQGKYFKPHCRHITPYDDIVREHKRKQKLKEEFNVEADE